MRRTVRNPCDLTGYCGSGESGISVLIPKVVDEGVLLLPSCCTGAPAPPMGGQVAPLPQPRQARFVPRSSAPRAPRQTTVVRQTTALRRNPCKVGSCHNGGISVWLPKVFPQFTDPYGHPAVIFIPHCCTGGVPLSPQVQTQGQTGFIAPTSVTPGTESRQATVVQRTAMRRNPPPGQQYVGQRMQGTFDCTIAAPGHVQCDFREPRYAGQQAPNPYGMGRGLGPQYMAATGQLPPWCPHRSLAANPGTECDFDDATCPEGWEHIQDDDNPGGKGECWTEAGPENWVAVPAYCPEPVPAPPAPQVWVYPQAVYRPPHRPHRPHPPQRPPRPPQSPPQAQPMPMPRPPSTAPNPAPSPLYAYPCGSCPDGSQAYCVDWDDGTSTGGVCAAALPTRRVLSAPPRRASVRRVPGPRGAVTPGAPTGEGPYCSHYEINGNIWAICCPIAPWGSPGEAAAHQTCYAWLAVPGPVGEDPELPPQLAAAGVQRIAPPAWGTLKRSEAGKNVERRATYVAQVQRTGAWAR